MNEIVDSTWYIGGSTCIGIVLLKREDGHRAYIGNGLGANQAADEIAITIAGAKFPNAHAERLWPHIKRWAP